MKKKLLAMLLVATTIVTMIGCGKKNDTQDTSTSETVPDNTTTVEEEDVEEYAKELYVDPLFDRFNILMASHDSDGYSYDDENFLLNNSDEIFSILEDFTEDRLAMPNTGYFEKISFENGEDNHEAAKTIGEYKSSVYSSDMTFYKSLEQTDAFVDTNTLDSLSDAIFEEVTKSDYMNTLLGNIEEVYVYYHDINESDDASNFILKFRGDTSIINKDIISLFDEMCQDTSYSSNTSDCIISYELDGAYADADAIEKGIADNFINSLRIDVLIGHVTFYYAIYTDDILMN